MVIIRYLIVWDFPTVLIKYEYLFSVLLKLLFEFDVLFFNSVKLSFESDSVNFDWSTKVFFQKLDWVLWFILFLIKTNEGTGKIVNDTSLFKIFTELLFFRFSCLRVLKWNLPDNSFLFVCNLIIIIISSINIKI